MGNQSCCRSVGQLLLPRSGEDDKLEGVRENGASTSCEWGSSHVGQINSTNRTYFVERLAVRMRRSQRQQHRHSDADHGSTDCLDDSCAKWRRDCEPNFVDHGCNDLLHRGWERAWDELAAV